MFVFVDIYHREQNSKCMLIKHLTFIRIAKKGMMKVSVALAGENGYFYKTLVGLLEVKINQLEDMA